MNYGLLTMGYGLWVMGYELSCFFTEYELNIAKLITHISYFITLLIHIS